MSNTAIVTEEQARQFQYSREEIELIKNTIAQGASDNELALFIKQCERTGLDPFARQIYSIQRKQKQGDQWVNRQVIQTSIDGFRLIAERTRKYAGQVGPWWCGKDGEWREVWLEDQPPAAAKVGVLRHDFTMPLFAIALYKSYVQTYTRNNQSYPSGRWEADPAGMLAKCAESLALRRAFPQELSGLYTGEEMAQADNATATIVLTEPAQEAEYHQEQTPAPKTNGKAKAAPAVQPAMDGSVTDKDFWNRANPMVKANVITGKDAYEIGAKHSGNWTAAIAELEEISAEAADDAARAAENE